MPERRTVHPSLDVRGALRWPPRDRARLLTHPDGRPMTAAEATEALLDVLARGVERLPIGAPCAGFDAKAGCPGHARTTAPTAAPEVAHAPIA